MVVDLGFAPDLMRGLTVIRVPAPRLLDQKFSVQHKFRATGDLPIAPAMRAAARFEDSRP
jgi:hypothetical protein